MGIQEAGSRDFQEPLGVQLELRFAWLDRGAVWLLFLAAVRPMWQPSSGKCLLLLLPEIQNRGRD